jgi:hypothetical protein
MSALTLVCLIVLHGAGNIFGQQDDSPLFIVFAFGAPLLVWYLGLSAFKKERKNRMTFKQGVIEGFKISLVYGFTSPFVFTAYYIFLNPDVISYIRTSYKLTGATDDIVIAVDMIAQFFGAVVVGTVYGIILSFFLKSKHK